MVPASTCLSAATQAGLRGWSVPMAYMMMLVSRKRVSVAAMTGLAREVLLLPVVILVWYLGFGEREEGLDRLGLIVGTLLFEIDLFSGIAKQRAKRFLLLFGDRLEIPVLPFRQED